MVISMMALAACGPPVAESDVADPEPQSAVSDTASNEADETDADAPPDAVAQVASDDDSAGAVPTAPEPTAPAPTEPAPTEPAPTAVPPTSTSLPTSTSAPAVPTFTVVPPTSVPPTPTYTVVPPTPVPPTPVPPTPVPLTQAAGSAPPLNAPTEDVAYLGTTGRPQLLNSYADW